MVMTRNALMIASTVAVTLPMPASAVAYIQVGASTGFNGDWVDARSRGYSSDNGKSHGYDSVNGVIVTNDDPMPDSVSVQSQTGESVAQATVDLANYKIGSYAEGEAYAYGEIFDDLVFTVQDADELTQTTFSVVFSMHSVNAIFDEAILNAFVGDMWGYMFVSDSVGGVSAASFADAEAGTGEVWSLDNSFYMTLTQSFTGPSFKASLWVHSDAMANGGVSDFSQTTSVEFFLPDNVTMVSSSGKIVIGDSSVTPPVPEPSTWMTLLAGLFAMGGVLRTQRRRHNARVYHA